MCFIVCVDECDVDADCIALCFFKHISMAGRVLQVLLYLHRIFCDTILHPKTFDALHRYYCQLFSKKNQTDIRYGSGTDIAGSVVFSMVSFMVCTGRGSEKYFLQHDDEDAALLDLRYALCGTAPCCHTSGTENYPDICTAVAKTAP